MFPRPLDERFCRSLDQEEATVSFRMVDEGEGLRELINIIDDAVIVTSPDLAEPGPFIEYVNTAFERMTGYSADEVIGRSPRILQGRETDRAELDRMRRELPGHICSVGRHEFDALLPALSR